MFERFTDRSLRVTQLARDRARSLRQDHVGTEHLLYGFLAEGECVAAKALASLGITLDRATTMAQMSLPGPGSPAGNIPFTPRMKKTLELGLREALQLGHNWIGTEHLLLGMTRLDDIRAMVVLDLMGVTGEQAREAVLALLHGYETAAAAPRPEPDREDPVLREILDRLTRIEQHLGMPSSTTPGGV
jgi:ATP-dependent Clp protease ATP-binding subunit ClpC